MILTTKQKRFVEIVQNKINTAKDANKKKKSATIKGTLNVEKLSVTNTGVYNDSYQHVIPGRVERHCRIHASVIFDVLLSLAGPHEYIKTIPMNGASVSFNGESTRRLLAIMRKNKSKEMKCYCCGLTAKYAYAERPISAKPGDGWNKNFSLSFYGVKPDGLEIRMNVDHIVAKASGKQNINDPSNLQVMCKDCNSLKASIPVEDFMHARQVLDQIKQNSKGTTV